MTGANAVSRKVDDVSRRPISPRTAERNFVKTTAALQREAQRRLDERPPTKGPPHHIQCKFGERCRRPDCVFSHPQQGQGPGPRRVSWDLRQGARSTQAWYGQINWTKWQLNQAYRKSAYRRSGKHAYKARGNRTHRNTAVWDCGRSHRTKRTTKGRQ